MYLALDLGRTVGRVDQQLHPDDLLLGDVTGETVQRVAAPLGAVRFVLLVDGAAQDRFELERFGGLGVRVADLAFGSALALADVRDRDWGVVDLGLGQGQIFGGNVHVVFVEDVVVILEGTLRRGTHGYALGVGVVQVLELDRLLAGVRAVGER